MTTGSGPDSAHWGSAYLYLESLSNMYQWNMEYTARLESAVEFQGKLFLYK